MIEKGVEMFDTLFLCVPKGAFREFRKFKEIKEFEVFSLYAFNFQFSIFHFQFP